MNEERNPYMDRALADRQRQIERESDWRLRRKPAHLLDRKDRDAFFALFDESDPLSDINVRRCWWNGDPPFHECGVLTMWHPMLFEQIPGPALNLLIMPLFQGFDLDEAFLWQSEETRWVYLSRCDPNHNLGDEDDGYPYSGVLGEKPKPAYVPTRYVQHITWGDRRLIFKTISAS